MTNSGDAAEQVVRLSLEGTEVALRLSGSAAKNIAAAIYTVYRNRDKNKIKGRQRLTAMLKSGKELKVFTINESNLRCFAKEANRYGVVYCALRGREKEADGMVDILVRAEDASKINRIVERFKLSTVDSASIKRDLQIEKAGKERDIQQKDNDDLLVEEMLAKPIQKEETSQENPFVAKTEKSPLSEPILTMPNSKGEGAVTTDYPEKRPSVREKLREIIESRKQQKAETVRQKEPDRPVKKSETNAVRHEQPKHSAKKKKHKER